VGYAAEGDMAGNAFKVMSNSNRVPSNVASSRLAEAKRAEYAWQQPSSGSCNLLRPRRGMRDVATLGAERNKLPHPPARQGAGLALRAGQLVRHGSEQPGRHLPISVGVVRLPPESRGLQVQEQFVHRFMSASPLASNWTIVGDESSRGAARRAVTVSV